MSSNAGQEGSEDVTDFLQRIKELGDKRDQEDEERNRKLEEEILQGRKERQARRSERARSISPTKSSSPANTPTAPRTTSLLPTTADQQLPSTPNPPAQEATIDSEMERRGAIRSRSNSPTKENYNLSLRSGEPSPGLDLQRTDLIKPSSPSSAMPSRSSPLSWQRRPNSQTSDPSRSRPLSMAAPENAARSQKPISPPEATSATAEDTPSRDQIAQSLSNKDPSWFRQTADRGMNSPAYRRTQVEDEVRSDHGMNSPRVQMPGMSREVSMEKSVEDPTDRSTSPSRSSAGYGSPSRASHHALSKSTTGFGSPIPMTSAQRLDPPGSDAKSDRVMAMSPSQGRISPDRLDRPLSPTKGMGGFVQSAMMKRSDSVNKRWTVQSPTGVNRANSMASNRSNNDSGNISPGGLAHTTTAPISGENSPRPSSRPTSSHNSNPAQENTPALSSMRGNASPSHDVFVKPALPASRSNTPQSLKVTPDISPDVATRSDASPPTSPTKTADPRRWSPTKSSWLESALNKPDSPKPKAVPPPSQPAWMSEIAKAKQKGSVDLGRSPSGPSKHEVSIGGLMRSPPPGGTTKPISISGLPAGFVAGAVSKSRAESISQESASSPRASDERKGSISTLTPSKSAPPPVAAKFKPDTPPKKDFRASLKSRQPPPASSGTGEPEFKNVFGQLKRTKTQNYVAPDELKNNITRGKAALSITGGPKKTERVDEFKDAILKKKEDFKKAQSEGKGIRPASGSVSDNTIPEALAKRMAMAKADQQPPQSPASLAKPSPDRIEPNTPTRETAASARTPGKDSIGGKLAGRFNPALAGLLARGPPSAASDASRSSSPAMSTSSQRTVSMSTSTTVGEPEAGPQLTHMTKGRARGPKRKNPTTTAAAPAPAPVESVIPLSAAEHIKSPSPPTENTSAFSKPSSPTKTTSPPVEKKALYSRPSSPTKPAGEAPVSQPSSPRKLDMKRRSQFLREAAIETSKVEPQLDTPKPLSPIKFANTTEIPVNIKSPSQDSPRSAKFSPPAPAKPTAFSSSTSKVGPLSPAQDKFKPAPLTPTTPSYFSKSTGSSNLDPPKAEISSISTPNNATPQALKTVKSVTALWNSPSETRSPQRSPRARSPIKLPTQDDENAAMVSAGLRSPDIRSPSLQSPSPLKVKSPIGLGIETPETPAARPLPIPATKVILSPPLSVGDSSLAVSPKLTDSLVPQASEASKLVSEFFGKQKPPTQDYRVDTAGILAARPDQDSSIRTISATLYTIGADGQKQPVPSHQERILFEGNIYLCLHEFVNNAGKTVKEMYYWLGDGVPRQTTAEIESIALREARTSGAKLVILSQGKETPEFFQALGGIIIVRRGTSNKFDSLAPHILCGRKYFGQIAFDEVDFNQNSLCSGFPYLISTPSGKSYLWKGKGSGIEELSCARLVGMDFGLMGEIEEIEDGKETSAFLDIFGGAEIPTSADHWRLKPNYSKYCSRLFCANSANKEQITEITPFSQADLTPSKIYVLDAFFEIYIVVGARAQGEYAAFHTALTFVQEYGIFAASMEDRPFVPVSTVVIEGIPRDMKWVFRCWREELTPTMIRKAGTGGQGGLRRGRSLRVVPLNAAIEATR